MKRAYNPHLIEPKWRAAWDRAGCDRAPDLPDGPKFFNYDSGPFPNGPLHMGHVRTYVLGDVTARYQRLLGRSVLYATEWDAFGLPNEIQALAEGTDPRTFTRRYVRQMRAQMRRLGISYDYGRIRNTSDPAYYRWTQWLFLELHERGLVERREGEATWCPSCRTALGTMQIERGACWRCGSGVEVRRLPQWFVDLSHPAASAERDLDGLGWSARARNGLRSAMAKSGRTTAWLVSRQRAWGTPIPIVHCGSCGAVPVPREQLPVRPGSADTACPRCGGEALRESDTLDCFFDDVWCFYASLVPIDRPKAQVFPSAEVDAWMPVDRFHSGYDTLIYLHLHRVIARVLAEAGHVRDAEPVRGYFGHDLVLSQGRKMSKHLGNTVAPLKLLRSYGADAMRVAVLWAAGPSRTIEWSPRHMGRAVEFLDAFYRLCVRFPDSDRHHPETAPVAATRAAATLEARASETFAEVGRYLEDYRPNVALERLAGVLKSIEGFLGPREAGRLAADDRKVVSGILRRFAIALVPFAPHLAEEASEKMGHPPFAVRARWPARIAQLLLAVAFATGCSARHEATQTSPAPKTNEGVAKATYIFDPANPALHLSDDVQFDRPRPDDANALPVYPERALREQAGTHREVVRIVIDTTGKVSEVLDSPLEASEDGPYAADFRRAVETAVRSWRFQPGHLRNVVPGNDVDGDGKVDYKVTTSFRAVAVYYDVRFTFEIVDGRGVVSPN